LLIARKQQATKQNGSNSFIQLEEKCKRKEIQRRNNNHNEFMSGYIHDTRLITARKKQATRQNIMFERLIKVIYSIVVQWQNERSLKKHTHTHTHTNNNNEIKQSFRQKNIHHQTQHYTAAFAVCLMGALPAW
jgi:hypothetical protein